MSKEDQIAHIAARFDYFNQLVFAGQLLVPKFYCKQVKTYLGRFSCKKQFKLFGRNKYYDFKISINSKLFIDIELLDDTILHEMIHLYIFQNTLKDTSPHGRLFRSMMADINQRFDRKIRISYRIRTGN